MPSNKPTCRILGTPQEFPVAAQASRDGHRRYNCPVCVRIEAKPVKP